MIAYLVYLKERGVAKKLNLIPKLMRLVVSVLLTELIVYSVLIYVGASNA